MFSRYQELRNSVHEASCLRIEQGVAQSFVGEEVLKGPDHRSKLHFA